MTGYCTFCYCFIMQILAYVDDAFFAYCLLDVCLLNFHMFIFNFIRQHFSCFFKSLLNCQNCELEYIQMLPAKVEIFVFRPALWKSREWGVTYSYLWSYYLSYMFWCWKRLLNFFLYDFGIVHQYLLFVFLFPVMCSDF